MTAAYSFVYVVTAKSSMKVLAELLKVSSPAVVDHIAETRDGFVAAVSLPGDPNSGAIYAYDRPTASMSCLSVDERVADFTAKEIDVMFPEVVRHLNTPSTSTQVSGNKQCESAPAHRRQQKHRHNNRRNNHPQRKGQNTGASARPHLVQVAA